MTEHAAASRAAEGASGPTSDRSDDLQASLVSDASKIHSALIRLSHEVIERNRAGGRVVLLGIPTRGIPLAERIRRHLRDLGTDAPSGILDPSPFRDDAAASAPPARTSVPFELEDKTVVLVDDVLFTGRTARAALDALVALGRPGAVQLAVLVDRGHRELPIRPDFVGINVPTSASQHVAVRLAEVDGSDDGVWIRGRPE